MSLDDIRETVFVSLLDQYVRTTINVFLPQDKLKHEPCFLQVENKQDPSPALLTRLKNLSYECKPSSQAEISAYGVIDRKTGQRGILFRIDDIQMLSTKNAKVVGGYFSYGLAASGDIFQVDIIDENWVVTKIENVWIS